MNKKNSSAILNHILLDTERFVLLAGIWVVRKHHNSGFWRRDITGDICQKQQCLELSGLEAVM
jgi:hypothetical protein